MLRSETGQRSTLTRHAVQKTAFRWGTSARQAAQRAGLNPSPSHRNMHGPDRPVARPVARQTLMGGGSTDDSVSGRSDSPLSEGSREATDADRQSSSVRP